VPDGANAFYANQDASKVFPILRFKTDTRPENLSVNLGGQITDISDFGNEHENVFIFFSVLFSFSSKTSKDAID
jgi:hypothetical protein